ncbi:DVUA0089 family protein, partial [Rubripirellula sp.]|nr:DVUA0089 family protein [Rubripirellula sp.]
MTLRDSSDRNQSRKGIRTFSERLRSKLRRKDRRLLTESLEQRQLLAGPDLVAIQHSDQVIQDTQVLTDAPRELIFRFDNQTPIDPTTIQNGISITRAGSDGTFETASASTDFGTSGQVLVEFRSLAPGSSGNGIQLHLRSSDRGTSTQQVLVDVDLTDQVISFDLNSNAVSPSTVRDLLTALAGNPQASSLVEAYQVTGSSLNGVGDNVGNGIDLELIGANSAEYVTDLGTGGQVWTRLVANTSGSQGVGTRVDVSRIPLNLADGQLPYVSVSGKTIQVILDSTPGRESTARDFVAAINSNIDASSLITAQFQSGNLDTVVSSTSFSPLVLVGATDTVVVPGYVGLGDTPHEVVFRFNEPLPQDIYQVEVFGVGPLALKDTAGQAFDDGQNLGLRFSVNNAPQVAAVVPNPVRRNSNGTLVAASNVVEVYFTENIANPTDINFYELIYTRDTVSNLDDVVIHPTDVTYDSINKVARLEFASDLSSVPDPIAPSEALTGAARLRVGGARPATSTPSEIVPGSEPGDAFSQAFSIDSAALNGGTGGTETVVLQGSIDNQSVPYDLRFPGGSDVPGVRNIRPEDPARLDLAVPLDVWRKDADQVNGITTVYYDFPDTWMGDDPQSGLIAEPDRLKQYSSSITEQQKQRVREALSMYSEYLGVQFVETSGVPQEAVAENATYIAIAVGELYGAGFTTFENSEVGGVTVATRPLDGAGDTFLANDLDADVKRAAGNNLLVMDFQDFSDSTDDQLGGEFFRGAMLGVGQLLGYGYADHLSQPVTQATASVLSPGVDNEATFPSPADIVNGQYLFRPESNDIDLYRFTLENDGAVSIQTIAERLQSASSLDTALRLYQNQEGSWVEIAANDDYLSNDSLIDLELTAGEYIVGVSASGNDVYDPSISGTGIGGRTEGEYDLRITFKADGQSHLVDQHMLQLDGDMDGKQGGDFNFWFLPSSPTTTTYVDSSYSGARSGLLGSISNPYSSVNEAIESAGSRFGLDPTAVQQVRVVGGDYTIGLNNLGIPLDGATLELPRGVQLLVDAGSTFKMSRSRIGVGSTTEGVDRSQSSIQVLGVPGNPVRFTSAQSNPKPGDWGGIDIRQDIDSSDGSRVNDESRGIFYNHIQFADIQYGGGAVSIDGRQVEVSPIELASARPTIINSEITNSADAAIAATPESFTETRFDEYRFQRDGLFSPDYGRVGPHIRGNQLVDNTINGVLFRIQTPSGGELEKLRANVRLDDTDVVHVLTENLILEGSAGGVNASVASPESLLIRGLAAIGGSVEQGQYSYKITFFNQEGYETSPSAATQTISVGLGRDAIQLSSLPVIPQSLVDQGFIGRRLYRANADGGIIGEYRQVADLNASDLQYLDTLSRAEVSSNIEIGPQDVRLGRLSAGLTIDPGTVVKLQGSRIELTFGAHLYAEGTVSDPIVFTSARDTRYGTGGTFETVASEETQVTGLAGDWGGIYAGFGATLSLDHATLAGGGGSTRIEGGFASFNVIEVHQADLRLANSRLEDNADGRGLVNDPRDLTFDRVGRSGNASGTVFVRGSQPVVVNNDFIDGNGPVLSIDLNSFS